MRMRGSYDGMARFRECRALLREYRALLREYRALLREYRAPTTRLF